MFGPFRNREKEAKLMTSSLSSVCLAAAFVVNDDEAWMKFSKFLTDRDTQPVGDSERRALDYAISLIDNVRISTCKEWNIKTGVQYERQYKL